MPKIIALTGPKGCGKDTAAAAIIDYCVRNHPTIKAEQIAFADPIKDRVMHLFGLNTIDQYDVFKRSSVNVNDNEIGGRHIVREIGMLMREYNVNQFVEYVDSYINLHDNDGMVWVITDLRFSNELDYLQKMNALIVNINRISIVDGDTHVTERGFDRDVYDVTVDNQSSVEEYRSHVVDVISKKMVKRGWLHSEE